MKFLLTVDLPPDQAKRIADEIKARNLVQIEMCAEAYGVRDWFSVTYIEGIDEAPDNSD